MATLLLSTLVVIIKIIHPHVAKDLHNYPVDLWVKGAFPIRQSLRFIAYRGFLELSA